MSSNEMPAALRGLAWTADGHETTPDDPAALPGFPTLQTVDQAFTLLCDMRHDDYPPTDTQWRRILGTLAIGWGAGLRSGDPHGPEAATRIRQLTAWWEQQDAEAGERS